MEDDSLERETEEREGGIFPSIMLLAPLAKVSYFLLKRARSHTLEYALTHDRTTRVISRER
jgi:hypothetical protein